MDHKSINFFILRDLQLIKIRIGYDIDASENAECRMVLVTVKIIANMKTNVSWSNYSKGVKRSVVNIRHLTRNSE